MSTVQSTGSRLDSIDHQAGVFPIADYPSPMVLAQYPLLPWFGVLALGYGFAEVYGWTRERRRAFLVGLGVVLAVAFVALRFLNGYGDPRPWTRQADAITTAMSFFNVQKYPPSLLFVLATLSPSILALGLLEGRTLAKGRVAHS